MLGFGNREMLKLIHSAGAGPNSPEPGGLSRSVQHILTQGVENPPLEGIRDKKYILEYRVMVARMALPRTNE